MSESQPLRPDESRADYARFYDLVGADQMEERYYVEHPWALARFHLIGELLRPLAERGAELLDVGCASGYYSVAYASRGGRVTGLDIADSSLALAARRAELAGVAERCSWTTGDIRELPFDDASFDALLMTEVLEHVREARIAVEEAVRVLRPGGTLVVSTPGALDDRPWRERLRKRRAPTPEAAGVELERTGVSDSAAGRGIEHEAYFHNAFTLPQLAGLLPEGAEPVQLRSVWFDPPRVLWIPLVLRRRLGRGEAQTPADRGSDQPVSLPELDGEARVVARWSRLCARVPIVRETGFQALMVARRS